MAKLESGTRIYGNVTVDTFVTATGNITGGNILTAGAISATAANADIGTTTANSTYNFGTGVTPAGNTKNINIGTAGAASSNTIITIGTTLGTGNVTFPANTTVVIANTGGLALSTVGNITGGNLRTAGLISATANITGGNLLTAGLVSATGNSVFSNVKLTKFNETTVASTNTSTAITPDVATGTIFAYTANNNFTFNSLANAVAGSSATVIITQDATGSRLLTSSMKFANASKTLSTAASSIDIITVFYDGTTYYASLTKGYA